MASYSYIKDIQDPDPRGWNVDTREYTIYNRDAEDPDDNEIPHPYQDEFEDDESDEEYAEEDVTDSDQESDTSSVNSMKVNPIKKKFKHILQEEEFVPE